MRLVLAFVGLSLSSAALAQTDPHSGHNMAAPLEQESAEEIGSVPAPAVPTDHAADTIFDPTEMAKARAAIRRENGGLPVSRISFELAEYQARRGSDGYRFEGEASSGGDIDRLTIKYEGEGTFGGALDDAELQLLWSRAFAPFWNLHAGIRYDAKPDPSRTYLSVGVEGFTPYLFKLAGTTFISDEGDVLLRAEGYYDQRISQRVTLQPRIEVNFSAQDVPEIGIGAGLSRFEAGLRLRYEIKRELAPYMGIEWVRETGNTARFARAAGEDPSVTNFVFGIRAWF